MVELAVETGIPVAVWLRESDAVVATAVDVLERRAAEIKKAAGG